MKIDLCKLLGVEEGEEFKIKPFGAIEKYKVINKYRFKNCKLEYYSDCLDKWQDSILDFNTVLNSEIIKLPERKKFTDDELCILRNIDKKYKWIARDEIGRDEYGKSGNLRIYIGKPQKCIYIGKPQKNTVIWSYDNYRDFGGYNHLFNSIKYEDEEPVYIDDYVER